MDRKDLLLQKMAVLDELLALDTEPKKQEPKAEKKAEPKAEPKKSIREYKKYDEKTDPYAIVFDRLDEYKSNKQDIVFKDVVKFFDELVPKHIARTRVKTWYKKNTKYYNETKIHQAASDGKLMPMLTLSYKSGSERISNEQ